jgi:hypothetical protein
LKTGPQSDVFDYNTGEWNNTEAVPQTFNPEKPPFAAVAANLLNESFEERLYRLGKLRRPDEDNRAIPSEAGGMHKEVQGEVQGDVQTGWFHWDFDPSRDIR